MVEVDYDPAKVDYDTLLDVFFDCHDATQVNRQGPDVGTQYRSAVFFLDDEQAEAARAAKQRRITHGEPIATEITAAGRFWRAEDYHQQYIAKRRSRPAGAGILGSLFR